jgi:hypothetical protein
MSLNDIAVGIKWKHFYRHANGPTFDVNINCTLLLGYFNVGRYALASVRISIYLRTARFWVQMDAFSGNRSRRFRVLVPLLGLEQTPVGTLRSSSGCR